MQYFFKILISALIIVLVSELGKRYSAVAAIFASLPLVSIMALVWLYIDTSNVQKSIDLSINIFYAVLPSLLFFIVFPLLLKKGVNFWLALGLSILIMFLAYTVYVLILKKLNLIFL